MQEVDHFTTFNFFQQRILVTKNTNYKRGQQSYKKKKLRPRIARRRCGKIDEIDTRLDASNQL
jgi:hypothetical protein